MNDYFIRVSDEAALHVALLAAGAAVEQEGELLLAAGVDLDIIGTHYDRSGTDDEPIFTARQGYYANVRAATALDWPAGISLPEPITPWRVWA